MIVDNALLNGLKRNSDDIDRDILEYLILNPLGVVQTKLMYKANMSHNQVNVYFTKLLSKGYVFVVDDGLSQSTFRLKKCSQYRYTTNVTTRKIFRITRKGIEYYIRLKLLR